MRFLFLTLFLAAQIYDAKGQPDSILTEINKDVWFPFIETYSNFDADGFMSIHSEDVIRVNRDGKSIRIGDEYSESMHKNSKRNIERQTKRTIEFSFLERIVRKDVAFEVGYYKVTRQVPEKPAQIFYGKFQVLLKKLDGKWKIYLDSDTSNDGKIGEENFQNGEVLD